MSYNIVNEYNQQQRETTRDLFFVTFSKKNKRLENDFK